MYHRYAGDHGSQKRASNFLRWESLAVSCHVCAMGWESDVAPLEKQQALLTAEPPLQSRLSLLKVAGLWPVWSPWRQITWTRHHSGMCTEKLTKQPKLIALSSGHAVSARPSKHLCLATTTVIFKPRKWLSEVRYVQHFCERPPPFVKTVFSFWKLFLDSDMCVSDMCSHLENTHSVKGEKPQESS